MKLYIKEILSKKGLTQKDLAEKLGLNYTAFNNTLNGNPTISTLEKVANALDVKLADLFVEPTDNFTAVVIEGDKFSVYKSREELKNAL